MDFQKKNMWLLFLKTHLPIIFDHFSLLKSGNPLNRRADSGWDGPTNGSDRPSGLLSPKIGNDKCTLPLFKNLSQNQRWRSQGIDLSQVADDCHVWLSDRMVSYYYIDLLCGVFRSDITCTIDLTAQSSLIWTTLRSLTTIYYNQFQPCGYPHR